MVPGSTPGVGSFRIGAGNGFLRWLCPCSFNWPERPPRKRKVPGSIPGMGSWARPGDRSASSYGNGIRVTDAGRVAGFMPVPAHHLVRWQSGQMRPAVTRLIFIYAGSNPARTTTGLAAPLRGR